MKNKHYRLVVSVILLLVLGTAMFCGGCNGEKKQSEAEVFKWRMNAYFPESMTFSKDIQDWCERIREKSDNCKMNCPGL